MGAIAKEKKSNIEINSNEWQLQGKLFIIMKLTVVLGRIS
jgi:hypothetical protein